MGVKLVNNLPKILVAVKEQVAQGINDAAQWWTDEAQENANVDTGFMQSHIGVTEAASPNRLSATVRSLAPYSMYQDSGIHGNQFWTRAYLSTREKFVQFIYKGRAYTGGAGRGVISAAMQDYYHSITEKGLRGTKVRAFGGGFMVRGAGGHFVGRYGR